MSKLEDILDFIEEANTGNGRKWYLTMSGEAFDSTFSSRNTKKALFNFQGMLDNLGLRGFKCLACESGDHVLAGFDRPLDRTAMVNIAKTLSEDFKGLTPDWYQKKFGVVGIKTAESERGEGADDVESFSENFVELVARIQSKI